MRCIIVGLGIQGKKRLAVAGSDVVATVDPVDGQAQYQAVEQVPLDAYDAALVCTPDSVKLGILNYLLAHRKHVLVEKPLLASDAGPLTQLQQLAQHSGAACYTAYNHRFEPHLVRVKELLDATVLGPIYLARFFYGNGTARDVRQSAWRDRGLGVLPDLGSHLLDLVLFLFGPDGHTFQPWACHRFENRSYDHFLFGSRGRLALELEITLLSWRNSFTLDIYGELGSIHVNGLCKWGPCTLTFRKRVLPSGRPSEQAQTLENPDPTWVHEHEHFNQLCRTGGTNLANDLWIHHALDKVSQQTTGGLAA